MAVLIPFFKAYFKILSMDIFIDLIMDGLKILKYKIFNEPMLNSGALVYNGSKIIPFKIIGKKIYKDSLKTIRDISKAIDTFLFPPYYLGDLGNIQPIGPLQIVEDPIVIIRYSIDKTFG
jgi:hypothetical protein